jgi:hypothetical protein
VATNHSSASKTEEYTCSYNLSGQFVALKPMRCKSDEVLHVTVIDGNGDTLLDDRKLPMEQPVLKQNTVSLLRGSAEIAATIGLFPVDSTSSEASSAGQQKICQSGFV